MPRRLKRLAHNLKGVSANFEASQITVPAHELDTLAAQANLTKAADLIKLIEDQIPLLARSLEEIRSQGNGHQ